jgi:hypothetical protein
MSVPDRACGIADTLTTLDELRAGGAEVVSVADCRE